MGEPKQRSELRRYRLIRLYLDELREIEAIFAEIPGGDPPRTVMEGARWVADDLDELVAKEAPGPLTELEIRRDAGPRHLKLTLATWEARLFANNVDDLALRGAFDHVETIIRAAQLNPVARLLAGPVGTNTFATMALTAASLAVLAAITGRVAAALWGALGAVLFGVAFVIAWITGMRRGVLAYLEHRRDSPSFIARNRDRLILAAFSAALGVIATLILQALT